LESAITIVEQRGSSASQERTLELLKKQLDAYKKAKDALPIAWSIYILSTLYNGFIAWYLLRPSVKEYYAP
jgi:hypothetical protein